MQTGLARSLLLILLLALTGQALAAGCVTDADMSMPMGMDGDHQSHCAPDAGGDCASPGTDCNGDCNCCPGHCTSLLPAGDSSTSVPAGHSRATAYREFNTSPDPEATLRPPIPH